MSDDKLSGSLASQISDRERGAVDSGQQTSGTGQTDIIDVRQVQTTGHFECWFMTRAHAISFIAS